MHRSLALLAACALAATVAVSAQQTTPPAAPVPRQNSRSASQHQASRHDREEAEKLFLEGAKDLERHDLQAAMEAFTRAAALNPEERKYAFSADIARQFIVRDLIQQADKAKILGHLAEARAKIAEAYRLDPANPMVAQHRDDLALMPAGGGAALQPGFEVAAPPVKLQPKQARFSFHISGSMRSVIPQVLSAYGIQATLDDSVEPRTIRYDVDDVDFAMAERTLALATDTFFVPLDPARALVARDNRNNRDKFERNAEETVYLPDITGEASSEEFSQTSNLAKEFFGARAAVSETGQHAMTIRGPAAELPALNATLADLFEGRAEVQLDVHMYEVDRTRATDLGAILPTQTSLFNVYSEARSVLESNSSLVQEIVSSGLAAPGDWEAILGILIASGQLSNTILTQPFGIFGGGLTTTGISYSGGSLNMQLNSSDVHSIDQMELRVQDREEATIRDGERYPIITSSYSSLSATSLNIPGLSTPGLSSTLSNLGISASALASAAEETIPQVQYQDIGLTLTVTPHLEGPHQVSLKFDLKLSSLAGSSLNDLPLLNNREFAAITSVKMGQSAVLVSALSRQESDAITGIPGLTDLPGFQDGTNKDTNLDYSRLAIVITPHLVRAPHLDTVEKMVMLPH